MAIIELLAGLALLVVGGDALVRGSVSVARRLGLSPLVIGLTLVGFGTSTPELVASLQAALRGAPGIAVGNIVGSNIANVLLILGVAALLMPIAATAAVLRRDGTVLLFSTAVMVAIVLTGALSRPAGLVLVALLIAYTIASLVLARRSPENAVDAVPTGWPRSLAGALLVSLGGILAVVFGADLLVGGAIVLAAALGVSEAVIGLTVVAVGTSLPELVTAVVAALRREADVAFGNVIGSNIFNILGIAGATALVAPIPVPAEVVRLDVWVMTLAAILLVVFAASAKRVSRTEGAILLALYAIYLALQFTPPARAALGLG